VAIRDTDQGATPLRSRVVACESSNQPLPGKFIQPVQNPDEFAIITAPHQDYDCMLSTMRNLAFPDIILA
jgi:hypothetical protein